MTQPAVRRGEIWWAWLPEPVGSEPGSRRPLLVVQADSFNRSRIQTVLATASPAGRLICSSRPSAAAGPAAAAP